MAGLFDYQDPDSVGRMMFAAGLLNAAGPSKMPVSTGQALAQGLLARQQGATEAGQNARRNELIAAQVQQQQMMMRELQRQQAEQEQARELMRQSYQTPGQQAVSQFGGPTKAAAQAMPQMPGGFNAAFMKDAAFKAGNPYAVTLAESYQKPRNLQTVKAGERVYDMTDPSKPKELIGGVSDEWELSPTQPFPGQQLYIHKFTREPKVVGTRPPVTNITIGGAEKGYLGEAQTGLAKSDVQMYNDAQMASSANKSLDRIEKIIADGGVSGGPLASLEVFGRNVAAEYGIPVNRVVDRNNARLTAEFTSRIASQVLSGGRGISNDDRKALEAAFPSFNSGIPADQLPSFIQQLRQVNNDKVQLWKSRYDTLPQQYKAAYPATFGSFRSNTAQDSPVQPQASAPSTPPQQQPKAAAPAVPIGTESVMLDGTPVVFDGKGWKRK